MTVRRALIALCVASFVATASVVSACGVGERNARVEFLGSAGSFIEFAPPMATRHLRP